MSTTWTGTGRSRRAPPAPPPITAATLCPLQSPPGGACVSSPGRCGRTQPGGASASASAGRGPRVEVLPGGQGLASCCFFHLDSPPFTPPFVRRHLFRRAYGALPGPSRSRPPSGAPWDLGGRPFPGNSTAAGRGRFGPALGAVGTLTRECPQEAGGQTPDPACRAPAAADAARSEGPHPAGCPVPRAPSQTTHTCSAGAQPFEARVHSSLSDRGQGRPPTDARTDVVRPHPGLSLSPDEDGRSATCHQVDGPGGRDAHL